MARANKLKEDNLMSRARQKEMASGSNDSRNRTRPSPTMIDYLKRKGSFLVRQFGNPQGPLLDRQGKSTKLALSARNWGECVPKNSAAAKRLAKKGKLSSRNFTRNWKSGEHGLFQGNLR